MATLFQDLRYGLRSLARAPGFTAVVVLTLALGIGANTAIFSVVNGVLLGPLPFKDSERLVRIYEIPPAGWHLGLSPPNFMSLREQTATMESVATYESTSLTLTGEGDPEQLQAMKVSSGFFNLLGISHVRGRSFLPEEEGGGAEPVAILGHGLWQRRFGGDADILGRTITLSGVRRTVVGISPPTYRLGGETPDVSIPSHFTARDLSGRGRRWLGVLGRLNPGVDLDAAARELEVISGRLSEAYPETNEGWRMAAVPLRRDIVGEARMPLLVLLGAVGLVLLIACANVASLLLARSESRRREIAVRIALGAGRARLLQQLFTETIALAALGGLVGLGLAYNGTEILLASIGSQLPRSTDVSIDWPVLAFTISITLLAGILVGLVPASQGLRVDVQSSLKEGAPTGLTGLGRQRLRGALVVAEIALSLMLVIGAGLLLKSFWRLIHVDAGFSKERVLMGRISLPPSKYETPQQRAAFFAALVAEAEQLPGAESAAAVEMLPITGWHATNITPPGRPGEEPQRVERRNVTPGYFRTMGISLIAGRPIEETDRPDTPHVIAVNETFARRLFPGEDVVGKRFLWQGPTQLEDLEIVGVVGDTKTLGLGQDTLPMMYIPNAQIQPAPSMVLAVRSAVDPAHLTNALRQTVWNLNPDLPVYEVATMEQIVTRSMTSERSLLLLLGMLAALALMLAAVGVYGILSYTVSQRTRELGIRMAMGAGKTAVLRLVIRQGMSLALIGVALGTVGALALNRILTGLLFDVSATDPATFAVVMMFVLAVALAACYLPARRAASVDPIEALRYE